MVFTLNFTQGGFISVAKSLFANKGEATKKIIPIIKEAVAVKSDSGSVTETDWLCEDVNFEHTLETDTHYILSVNFECHVTINTDDDIDDPEQFGYDNIALHFQSEGLSIYFDVKHSEVIAV